MPRSMATRSVTSTASGRTAKSATATDVDFPPLDSPVWEDIYELKTEEVDEPHGSVIGHIFSQLKPGMDLTKIVLPTWILERRSLLEMFADFFVHPDEFISIAQKTTPTTRMIQCLRWYLSSFHAGRPSDIAKKPYNPIIGETFTCWMSPLAEANQESTSEPRQEAMADLERGQDTPPIADDTGNHNRSSASSSARAKANEEEARKKAEEELRAKAAGEKKQREVGGGPCPWTEKRMLTFIAEQVSHRPPVSCFYTENISNRISMTSHIWTKSKFLGLSIGMECVGQGIISVHDLDEHYVITFPKAYGRSILTTPWFEMGGSCEIKCAKTGFSANVVFHEKPLIMGQKHKVSAEVKAPSERKPILKIEGHWNGTLFVSDSEKKTKSWVQTEFLDTKTLPVVKKQTKPLEKQQEFESRKLWHKVTWCLKNKIVDGKIDGATKYKTELEERQREGETHRQTTGIRWMPKFFRPQDDGSYVYCSPLSKRLRGDYSMA